MWRCGGSRAFLRTCFAKLFGLHFAGETKRRVAGIRKGISPIYAASHSLRTHLSPKIMYIVATLGAAAVASAASIYNYPYPNGSFDGGELIENMPTVELPIQTTYANGKYKNAVFLSNDGMVSFRPCLGSEKGS